MITYHFLRKMRVINQDGRAILSTKKDAGDESKRKVPRCWCHRPGPAHRTFPFQSPLQLDRLISAPRIDNLYDWSSVSHLLLLNVKGERSWPPHPPRALTGNRRGWQASVLSDAGLSCLSDRF